IAVFAVLVGAGLLNRRRSPTHKRLMLVATIAILPAAIARIPLDFIDGPLAFFGLADLLLVLCVAYDTIAHRRLHPAYLWGGLLLILSHPLRLRLGATAAWHSFAQWLV